MSRQTERNLFINPPSVERAEFYQHLLKGICTFEELGNRVLGKIKAAHAFRQVDVVRELSSILINFPIKEYQLIGQYYFVWCKCRNNQYDGDTLEHIISQTYTYKTKALISRAAFEGYQMNVERELYFYIEASKSQPTISEYIDISKSIAVIKAKEGFHKWALKELESLVPIIRHAEPVIYFDVLNSLAVELIESGRKDEARNVIRHVIASPFTFAYPEWQETAQELREPARPSVAVPHIEREPVEVQPIQSHHASKEARPNRPRRVIPFPPLKEVPKPNRPHRVTPQEFDDMTADERAELILASVKSGAVKESEYVRLAISLGLLGSGPASKVIDLEDEAVLNDIITVWCNMIDPEEFASVISALRDCKDDLRRAEIMDSMITIAFRQSPTSIQTEQEWRMRVECKLPEK